MFRSLPPLVVIVLIYFGLPSVDLSLSGFVSTWLSLALVLMAFSEEIFWAGITSVAKGQWEAARSTGLTFGQTLAHVVMPQALRLTIPPRDPGAGELGGVQFVQSIAAADGRRRLPRAVLPRRGGGTLHRDPLGVEAMIQTFFNREIIAASWPIVLAGLCNTVLLSLLVVSAAG